MIREVLELSNNQEMIVLFDEQGTPAFDRDTSNLIGVSLLYLEENEQYVFDSCDEAFALSNKRPLKNDRVKRSRAECMAECLGSLPVWMLAMTIDMTDKRLRMSVEKHKNFSDAVRARFRGHTRERKIAQILHTSLLINSIFIIITNHLETVSNSYLVYHPFMDNWAIPEADRSIIIDEQSESLEQKINSGCQELGHKVSVEVKSIQMLSEDSSRKRLIDGCATIVSRAYLDENNVKYSSEPVEILKTALGRRFRIGDMTDYEVSFMDEFREAHK